MRAWDFTVSFNVNFFNGSVIMAKTLGKKLTILETETNEEHNFSGETSKTESQPETNLTESGGIRKEYLNDTNVCRVTFKLPKEATNGSENVCVVGEFNNWDTHANPMEKCEDGDFITVFDLESGREYQFRYLIDDSIWENDWHADKYVQSCYSDSDNSVVVT